MLTKPSVLARQLPELKKFAIFAKVEISENHGQAVGVAGQETDGWIAGQYGLQESGLIEGAWRCGSRPIAGCWSANSRWR